MVGKMNSTDSTASFASVLNTMRQSLSQPASSVICVNQNQNSNSIEPSKTSHHMNHQQTLCSNDTCDSIDVGCGKPRNASSISNSVHKSKRDGNNPENKAISKEKCAVNFQTADKNVGSCIKHVS